MKWLGQYVQSFTSRFRSDVYLESLSTTTESNVLVVDSAGKISKSTSVGGDITSVVAGSGMTGGGVSGDVTLDVIGGDGLTAALNDISITPGQTTITSIHNAALKVGRDDNNLIDFATSVGRIYFRTSGADRLALTDTILLPTTNNHTSLGTLGLKFKDAHFDGVVNSDSFVGPLTGDASGSSGTVTNIGNLTGDVTSSNRATTLTASQANITTLAGVTSIGTAGTGLCDFLSGTFQMVNENQTYPRINMVSQYDSALGGIISLEKQRRVGSVGTGAIKAGEDGDNCGIINFNGYDTVPLARNFAQILGEIEDADAGSPGGKLSLGVASYNATLRSGLVLTGGSEDAEVDITLGLGANSVVTIPGNIDLAGDIDVDGTLETDALTIGGATIAAIGTTAITTLGTIGTGTWEGVTIKTAFIGDDQITEDKLDNGLLAEIDANTAKSTNVGTDLTVANSTLARTIASSDGTNATIPVATTSVSGVMSTGIFDEHTANNAKVTNSHVLHYGWRGYVAGLSSGNWQYAAYMGDQQYPEQLTTDYGNTVIANGELTDTSDWFRSSGMTLPRDVTAISMLGYASCVTTDNISIAMVRVNPIRNDKGSAGGGTSITPDVVATVTFAALNSHDKIEEFEVTSMTTASLQKGDILMPMVISPYSGNAKTTFFNLTLEVAF